MARGAGAAHSRDMATKSKPDSGSQQASNNLSEPAKDSEETVGVNRKKQKRREKQAAKLAASQAQTPAGSHPSNGVTHSKNDLVSKANPTTSYEHINGNHADHSREDEELFYSDEELEYDQAAVAQSSTKSKRKKKKKGTNGASNPQYEAFHVPGAFQPPPPPPPLAPSSQSNTVAKPSRNSHKRSIWNTSTTEERERIKEFWVGLDELERRSLVKVEKEAVLKKMKEQQKHSCSCSVCGRKRNAIEEELEVLYDAYYEELEQYANHRQLGIDGSHPMLPPPGPYHPTNRMPLRQDSRNVGSHVPSSSRMAGAFGNEELAEDEYTEDDGLDEEDDEDIDVDSFTSDMRHPAAADIFTLGKNLTAQGGILTVADDLLKNDGRKFIEMMEQLAERRMQREEEAQFAARGLSHPSSSTHNHAQMDDEEYEDEDEDDYGSEEEDDYDDDEMESMSEEQRMEEGRRMFQIFAARMFEQRVLTAYREKVAKERQEKLLEELADESRLDEQREAKKARDAAKKKEKKNKQKAVKEEERLKREAEKAEQEAAVQAAEEKKLEEQRARKEAQRKKREAEKQVQEAERQKKETDRLRKQQEAKEMQAEQERKQRENKEKEKKRKDEAKRKEREEREAKEKEKREHEAAAKAELEAKQAREREARDKSTREETTKPISQVVPVPIPLARKASSTIPPPPGFASAPSVTPSPHVQIATPALPKVQAPVKPRQASQQGSIHSSPKSATQPASSSATSPSSANIPTSHIMPPMPPKQMHPPTSIPQASNFNSAPIAPPPGIHHHHHPLGGIQMPPVIHNPPFAPGFGAGPPPPGILPRGPMGHDGAGFPQQPFNSQMYRGFGVPSNSIGFPPGMAPPPRQNMPVRGAGIETPAAQTPIGTGVTTSHTQPISHSRNTSLSNDQPSQIQPIGPPVATVRLPISHRQDPQKHDLDGVSQQLGSSALLDDGDDTLEPVPERSHMNPSAHRSSRLGFGGSPAFPDAISSAKNDVPPRSGWGAPPVGFGTPTMSHNPHWSPAPTHQWSSNAFGGINTSRQPRAVVLRLLICQACKALSNHQLTGEPAGYGSHPIDLIMYHIEQNRPPAEPSPQLKEVLEICETEGNLQNGGGNLAALQEHNRGLCVTWVPDAMQSNRGPSGGPGEIGSPIIGSAHPFGGSRPFPGISNTPF